MKHNTLIESSVEASVAGVTVAAVQTRAERRDGLIRKRWEAANRLWDLGFSKRLIGMVMGYGSLAAISTKIATLRKRWPGFFAQRPQGFIPIDYALPSAYLKAIGMTILPMGVAATEE
jgi:hypothetical protein